MNEAAGLGTAGMSGKASREKRLSITIPPDILPWLDSQISRHVFDSYQHAVTKCLFDAKERHEYGILQDVIESEPRLRDIAPYFSFESASDNSIFLRDAKTNKMIELRIKDGELQCTEDKSNHCLHVGFAWALPTVRREMVKRGQRPPRSSRD
jgi:hypothetical protein